MGFSKPTALLSDMDSHDIWDARALVECDFDVSKVPTFTAEETNAKLAELGTGGDFDAGEADQFIYGWTTAEALALTFLGEAPGRLYSGRGASFRANYLALERAGF